MMVMLRRVLILAAFVVTMCCAVGGRATQAPSLLAHLKALKQHSMSASLEGLLDESSPSDAGYADNFPIRKRSEKAATAASAATATANVDTNNAKEIDQDISLALMLYSALSECFSKNRCAKSLRILLDGDLDVLFRG